MWALFKKPEMLLWLFHFTDPMPLCWASGDRACQVIERRYLSRLIWVEKEMDPFWGEWVEAASEPFPSQHLNLQPRSHISRSMAWQDNTPTLAEENPRKQVRYEMDEELDDDPTLLLGLTLFLAEDMAAEWDDTPTSSTPMPMDSPWPAHYMVGAWPKVPAKSSADWLQLRTWSRPKEGPDLVNLPLR